MTDATTVDQLRHPLNDTVRVLERTPSHTVHGTTERCRTCR
ncbi:hypothetical protein [Streptomyces neyagawaensis]|nr:hypothetical protein [Streptomyces neyagawaensis]MDE1687715.1 hypothetical protein [Streptomyces neyagawaensis]MDG5808474.1 hypothetical protein [Streptomyces ossamyceticus]